MKIRNPFNWNLRFGTIPSDFTEAMTYEEQIIWLYSQIKELKEGSANYNYDMLENKPSIDGVVLQGNITKSQLGIEQNYNILTNKPQINGLTLQGNRSLNDLGIQGKLIPGSGIVISGNTISATGGGGTSGSYNNLTDKPSINGFELEGNKSAFDLGLQESLNINFVNEAIQNKYFDMTNIQIGDTIAPPFTLSSSVLYDVFIIKKIEGMHFEGLGEAQILLTNSSNEVVSLYNTEGSEHFYVDALTSGGYIIINILKNSGALPGYSFDFVFTASYLDTMFNKKANLSFSDNSIVLNADGTITNFDVSETKILALDFPIYLGSISESNLLFDKGDFVIFDKYENVLTFYNGMKSVRYESGEWNIYSNSNIENELTNSRNKIPTSQAVYQALQNIPSGDNFYTKLEAVILLNSDGTATCNGETLSYGYYLTSGYGIEYNNVVYGDYANTIIYINNQLGYIYKCIDDDRKALKDYFYYRSSNTTWERHQYNYNSSIPSSGDNNDIPTNQAVRDYVQQNQANYSTAEKVVGTWTNGKPLYEKVIVEEAPNVSTDGTIATKTSDLGVANAIDFAFVKNSFVKLSGSVWTCPYIAGSGRSVKTQITTTSGGVTRLQMSSDGIVYNGSTFYSVVNYTKTAD